MIDRKILLVFLPTLYLLLVVFTMFLSATLPGGAYYRIVGANPLAAVVGMVSEGAPFYIVLLIFGTLWWFFIGAIGWRNKRETLNRPMAALGALLSLLTAFAGIGMTKDTLRRDDELSIGAIVQYACVGILCLGALFVAFDSAKAALGLRRPQTPE